MVNCYRLLVVTLLAVLPGRVVADDPGLPDTLRLESEPFGLHVSSPITVSIFNDSTVMAVSVRLVMTRADSGFAAFDSVKYVGRLADPSVLPFRIVNPIRSDGVSPDTLIVACDRYGQNGLPIGDGPIMELYYSGLREGFLRIDSGSGLTASVEFVREGSISYVPIFNPLTVEVLSPNHPPDLELFAEGPIVGVVGDRISFEVAAASPTGSPVSLELSSLTDADDPLREPANRPTFEGIDSREFSWRPGPFDLGVWEAVFSAVDTLGSKTVAVMELQIVADDNCLMPLGRLATYNVTSAAGLAHGNIDADAAPELLVAGNPAWASGRSFASYDFAGGGQLQELFGLPAEYNEKGLDLAYLDADSYIDAVVVDFNHLRVLHARGDGSFAVDDDQPRVASWPRDGRLTDYDGDARLDYVVVCHDQVTVYRQGSDFAFAPVTTLIPTNTALTCSGADFNGDGWEDLAVGTTAGLEIFLHDGAGGYTPGETYGQTFGTVDIDVTNRGSDFNDDGYFDLCLATPSVGGEYSELKVYLGRGDGSFEPLLVRRVKGQIFANYPGDYNGDSHLDIAWVNGAREYLSIVFGGGDGSFLNERRYAVPDNSPRRVEGLDFDLDGDLDILVAGSQPGLGENAAFFLFENRLNPPAVVRTDFEVRAADNADLELRDPRGGRLSRVANSTASGDLYLRRLDDNDIIDAVAVTRTVVAGRYELVVRPRPQRPPGEAFSLEYKTAGNWYRIAVDQPAGPDGYLFPVYPVGVSPVSPRQGAYVQTSLPTFVWPSRGVERFELATDIGFTNILESATVSGGLYTPQLVLTETDSVPYFWRVRSESEPGPIPIYVFNAVRVPTDVDDSEATEGLPDSCRLAQNFPNPFNPVTTIEFYLPEGAPVKITIHNVLGQVIKSLLDQSMPAGTFTVEWDATDFYDREVASGIYFYRMEVGDFSNTRKMVLVR